MQEFSNLNIFTLHRNVNDKCFRYKKRKKILYFIKYDCFQTNFI